jgi:cardiolipin synthase
MTLLPSLLSPHVASVVGAAFAVTLAASVLRQRRPVGSAFAWLLAILLIPYVGIPLYLALGGRKFRRMASRKPRLDLPEPALAALRHAGAATDGKTLTERATRVVWLDDGVAAFQALLGEISAARRSIHVVTFLVADDEAGRAILDALTRRAAEGLEVLLLLDDLLRFRAPHGHLKRLEAAGGRVRRFMPLVHLPFRARSNLRNHRKLAVFDEERAVVGGMNLAVEYLGPTPRPGRWRDLSLLVSGTCVRTLADLFRSDWGFATGEPAAGAAPTGPAEGVPVQVVPSGPDTAGDAIYDALLQAIFTARHRIWIATPYFVPDEPLVRALQIAAHRGVEVRVVVPARSNHRLADLVAAPILRDLETEGVRVHRFGPSMLHAKAVLVDETLAAVGSANFDMRSLFLDFEVALFFSGSAEVARLASWFEATLAGAEEGAPRSSWLHAQVEAWARLLAPLV